MITVLAGVNGAGKSSIGGSALRAAGQEWYNPDALARQMQQRFPEYAPQDINSRVWKEGLRRLKDAIASNRNFAFETTLGGNTITQTLLDALAAGVPVRIWYCGLESVELHLERVAARARRGGHDIPEALIRKRYNSSMRNLCRLTPGLAELAVYDNSAALDAHRKPQLRWLLHAREKRLLRLDPDMPQWARPVASVCMKHFTAD